METKQSNGGKICLYCFLVVAAILGIIAFILSFTKKCGEGFDAKGNNSITNEELDELHKENDIDTYISKSSNLVKKYQGINISEDERKMLKKLLLDVNAEMEIGNSEKFSKFGWLNPSRLACYNYWCGNLMSTILGLPVYCNTLHSGTLKCKNKHGCGPNGAICMRNL